MGFMDSIARSFGSITIVDDLDDSSSSATYNANKRSAKRASAPASAPATNGDALRNRRLEKSRADRERERIAEMSAEELRRENRSLRHRAQKLEKEVAMYKRYAEHYRERRKESDRDRLRIEQQNKELETIVQNMRESYEQELMDLRDQLSKHGMSPPPLPVPAPTSGSAPISNQIPAVPPSPTGHTHGPEPTLGGTTIKVDRATTPTTKGQVPYQSTTAPSAPAAKSHPSHSHQPAYAQTDIVHLRRRLAEQTEEIRGLRSLLDTPDELSAAELADRLRVLNEEAASVTARIVDKVRLGHTWDVEQGWIEEASKPALAECLHILAGSKGIEFTEDSTLVQLAIQSYLLFCLSDVFNSFLIGLDPKDDKLLNSMYAIISYAEPQSVSSRWRVMSRLALTPPPRTFHDAVQRVVKEIKLEMLRGIESILRFAGANYPPGLLMSEIEASSGPALEHLIRRASSIADSLKDKVFSADYRVFVSSPGASFSHSEMESVDHEDPAGPKLRRSRVESEKEAEANALGLDGDDILQGGPNHIGAMVAATVGFGLKTVKRVKLRKSPSPKVNGKDSKDDKSKRKEKEKEREREKSKGKEREREREREKEREKKGKDRDKEREKDKDKRDIDAQSTASTEAGRELEENIIVKCKVLMSSTVKKLQRRAVVA